MTLNLSLPGHDDLKPRITVFGVGGAGGNAVNNMIDKELDGVEFVVANTDAQALQQSRSQAKIQMGIKVTEGLGAGARATVGAAAAEESIEQIVDHLAGAHMCFITAGMGGGTGTGAAPIIAQAARELGVLTVGVVTKPFQFEGNKRMRQAEEGVEALQKVVDTLIIIPNQNLFRLATENTTFTEAFALADDVLYQGVKGVTDLMVRPGLINLDFADVRSVMDEMGKAMMGTGEAEGEDRAKAAAEKAIANPLLDEISLKGAKGVLINITGGYDLTLFELDEAANTIREMVDPDANIIVGSTLDTSMEGRMRVSVVATGIDAMSRSSEVPAARRSMSMNQPIRQPEPAPRAAAPARTEQPRQQPAAAREPVREAAPRYEEPVARQAAERQPAERQYAERQPAQRQPERAPERSLFESYDDDDAYGRDQATGYDSHDAVADDSLPPPAYRPRPEPEIEAAETFVAPRAPQPGTPTPEAKARLAAALNRPGGNAAPRMTAEAPRAAEAEKPRFGINSLINRMTGQADAPAAPAPRQQPQVSALRDQPRADPQADADQERIEIPAFLRRQAN
ncbi:cell division protein FtsZ [Loktanella fryxellensis]|uniref:Cell division protein FtsZ n=1 Tax=Loktanella fryxellensis TaxID=245187 RepID=A0A1H7Z3U8_9RHOB|nr:cell division protein FtsZ [Loktanella fryxellensis]SEM53282.1 cell division protein FtsZ [Loktanella fryxellensis]